jgi:NAD(P)-dependent dehydrogenase (short-subunit alcohol dehydrogenase family)
MSFEKRVVVLTGAASGIGRAIAVSLGKRTAGAFASAGTRRPSRSSSRSPSASYTAVLSQLMRP